MRNALIVVDVQNDFCEGGSLAVPDANEIIISINTIRDAYDVVVFTQDWHPANHTSFATNHPGKKVFDVVAVNGLKQVLWPEHCIQDTFGAEIHGSVVFTNKDIFLKKGTDPEVDSYSAFYDNNHIHDTGLADMLRKMEVDEVYIAGLATDYCVKYTALDAIDEGFKTFVIVDATRGVNAKLGDVKQALIEMENKGVRFVY